MKFSDYFKNKSEQSSSESKTTQSYSDDPSDSLEKSFSFNPEVEGIAIEGDVGHVNLMVSSGSEEILVEFHGTLLNGGINEEAYIDDDGVLVIDYCVTENGTNLQDAYVDITIPNYIFNSFSCHLTSGNFTARIAGVVFLSYDVSSESGAIDIGQNTNVGEGFDLEFGDATFKSNSGDIDLVIHCQNPQSEDRYGYEHMDVTTNSGNIDAEVTSLRLNAEANSGDIDIHDGYEVKIDAKTNSGSIDVGFTAIVESFVNIFSRTGNIHFSANNASEYVSSDGNRADDLGGNCIVHVDLDSVNGEIEID